MLEAHQPTLARSATDEEAMDMPLGKERKISEDEKINIFAD